MVEEDIKTDSVELFSSPQTSQVPQKSSWIALAATIVLPGAGHQYADFQGRAMTYFSIELLSICGMVFSERYSTTLLNNAKAYAWKYAHTNAGNGPNDAYWVNVGQYMDSDGPGMSAPRGFNGDMEYNRAFEKKYVAPELQWRWDDDYYRIEYNGFRTRSMKFHVASTFFLAAMVLDRVISFVDLRVALNRQKSGLTGSHSVYPTFAIGPASFSYGLNFSF